VPHSGRESADCARYSPDAGISLHSLILPGEFADDPFMIAQLDSEEYFRIFAGALGGRGSGKLDEVQKCCFAVYSMRITNEYNASLRACKSMK
jgi:hypothetical protein